MKRINWENTVEKWESVETALINGYIYDAIVASKISCGYCHEYLDEDFLDPCCLCPLSHKKLCHYYQDEDKSRAYWCFRTFMFDLIRWPVSNSFSYGDRYKALVFCREILQGIYADMHDLED